MGSRLGYEGGGGCEGVQFIYTQAKDGVKAEVGGECYVLKKTKQKRRPSLAGAAGTLNARFHVNAAAPGSCDA